MSSQRFIPVAGFDAVVKREKRKRLSRRGGIGMLVLMVCLTLVDVAQMFRSQRKRKPFWEDKRGQVDIGTLAIELSIALVVVAYVFPIGLESIFGINFTAWHFVGESEDVKTTGLMKLVPLFAVLTLAIGVIMLVKRYTE